MKIDDKNNNENLNLPPITTFVIQYDRISKGNKYRYSPLHNKWFCCESPSGRSLYSSACLVVQSELNRIAERAGYSFARYVAVTEKKKRDTSQTKSKTKKKNFISLF